MIKKSRESKKWWIKCDTCSSSDYSWRCRCPQTVCSQLSLSPCSDSPIQMSRWSGRYGICNFKISKKKKSSSQGRSGNRSWNQNQNRISTFQYRPPPIKTFLKGKFFNQKIPSNISGPQSIVWTSDEDVTRRSFVQRQSRVSRNSVSERYNSRKKMIHTHTGG